MWTATDARRATRHPVRAKSNRIRARHLGAHKPRQVMPGSKASKFKRKMDGTVDNLGEHAHD